MEFVYLNSEDRILSNQNINNNTINFFDTLNGEYEFVEMSVMNNFYNITDYNNLLKITTITPAVQTITLVNAYYSAIDLGSHLQTKIRGAFSDNTWTVTYDGNKNKYTITHPSVTFIMTMNDLHNSSHKLIGFDATDQITYALSQESDNAIDLIPYKYIFIDLGRNKKVVSSSAQYFSFFMRPNVETEFSKILRFTSTTKQTIFFKNTKQINYEIYDEYKNLIDFNGCNFTIILKKRWI